MYRRLPFALRTLLKITNQTEKKYDYDLGQQILPHLYLGELAAAQSEDWKLKHKITHVLACLSGEQTRCTRRITINDVPNAQISEYFTETNDWIDRILHTNNKEYNLLVHCQAGISRSPTIDRYCVFN